ncbi:MAG: ATP-binding cassette domain-containing protein [Burkholderiales bacterium]|uniref:ATP-binding cassette domain-containing protein n=1 Tax=Roseateles sp. TaxID=1971397 RepID=UPI000FA38F0B|nr:MAG: ATP-binding cassette domain-containing protein [Burkholderiales bacterium]
MIDVRLQLDVADGRRRFDLDIAFATEAPFVALYGPSGAGKSLTLRAMAGLLRVRAGHVRLNGHTLLDTAAGIDLAPEARRVGYLFQHYALFPHLSVRQNIAFGLTSWRRRLQADDAARVDALIDSFGLKALADSRPATLSGGQQQRVALARALACQPQVLLLDEPFAALHVTLRRQLRAELRELRARLGIPALIVSHDPEDVTALADEVFVLDGGSVQRRLRTDDADLRAALEPAR